MRMHRKKKDRSCTSQVGLIKLATSAKLLDVTHKSYGFSARLLINEYQCSKARFIVGVITGLVMCKDSR